MSPDGTPGPATGAAAQAASTVRRTCRICNKLGLHARAARKFVMAAAKFNAEIWVRKNGTTVPGTDILELLMLEAPSGTAIEIIATGHDAATAVETLARLIECKFDED